MLLTSAIGSLRWALVVLTVVAVTGVQEAFATLGVPKVFLVAVAVGVVAALYSVRRAGGGLSRSPVLLAGAAWLASQAVSATLAADLDQSFAGLVDAVLAGVVLVTVAVLTRTDRDRRLAAAAAVTAMAFLGLLTAVQEGLGNVTTFGGFSLLSEDDFGLSARHSGPLSDANFWGRNLVLVLPLALWLASTSSRRRALWWGSVAVLLAAIVLSGSRGAYIACVLSVALWLALSGRAHRRALLAAPVALAALAVVPGVLPRLLELGQVGAVLGGSGDPSLVGRVAALEYGVQLTLDNPVTGVGPDNFVPAVQSLQRESGSSLAEPLAAHNAVLQVAAESGLPGLVAWVALFLVVGFVLVRALLQSSRASTQEREARALVVALMAAVSGWLVASLFLHLHTLPALAVVLGLCVSASQRPPAPAGAEEQETRTPVPARDRRVVVAAGLAAFLVTEAVVVSVAVLLGGSLGPRWEATQQLVLTPPGTAPDPYHVSLASRREIVATYADLITRLPGERVAPVGVTVQSRPSQSSSVITLQASGSERADVVTEVRDHASRAEKFLSGEDQDPFFVLAEGGGLEVQHGGSRVYPGLVLVAGQLLVGVAVVTVVRRLSGR